MVNKANCKLIIILQIILALQFSFALAQNADNPSLKNKNPDSSEALTPDSIKKALKEAVKENDREKERKHKQLVAELKLKLNQAVREWISAAQEKRKPALNKLQHENWDLGGKIAYPVPYDYYLRDFNYTIIKADFDSGSMVSGYKGTADIFEKLYIEAPHSSDATDVKKFFYTLSRKITLYFEYPQNKFVVVDIGYEPFQIKSDWKKD